MSLALVFCLFAFCALGLALNIDKLELNRNSSVFPSVYRVHHYLEERVVHIAFRRIHRCRSPTFLVRLSGESVYKLDLVGEMGRKYNFTYPPITDSGTYFIEVLMLYCTAFDPEGYYPRCLVDVHQGHNIVTKPYNFTVQPSATIGQQKRPRWVLGNHQNGTTLLQTMYQHKIKDAPANSTCIPNFLKTHCEPHESAVAQHRLYDWVDQPDWRAAMQSMLTLVNNASPPSGTDNAVASAGKVFVVCFVGDSHSRYLVEHGKFSLPGSRDLFSFVYIQSLVPSQFNTSLLDQHQCSVAVITYGQWLVSMAAKVPYTRARYKSEMSALMNQLTSSAYTGTTKIFMRSENYNGLGFYYTRCAPIDYRTVPVIDMLNSVQQELSDLYKLHYIDLNHIMGPMWDSAVDYCHPTGKVFNAQLEWILYTVFDTYNQRAEPLQMHHVTNHRHKPLEQYNGTMATEAIAIMQANVVPHKGARKIS